jgi:hypothetical protein
MLLLTMVLTVEGAAEVNNDSQSMLTATPDEPRRPVLVRTAAGCHAVRSTKTAGLLGTAVRPWQSLTLMLPCMDNMDKVGTA